MIKIQDLFYEYEQKAGPVIRDISLEISEGEYLGVIGTNGSGKTTFVKHLNGLLSPTAGDVRVDELSTKDRSSLIEIRQKVGMVFQNPDNQIIGMSVEEDVSFGPGNLRLPSSEIQARVKRSLDQVEMAKYAKRSPHTLSSGEKQLVAIAGVLAMNPKYVVLDEPTAYLDPAFSKKILQIIKGLHGLGITIIHVTHHMDEIAGADRIVVLNGGKIVRTGAPSTVFSEAQWLKDLGLTIPGMTELMWRLRNLGVDVRPGILTLDEAASELAGKINGLA